MVHVRLTDEFAVPAKVLLPLLRAQERGGGVPHVLLARACLDQSGSPGSDALPGDTLGQATSLTAPIASPSAAGPLTLPNPWELLC